MEGWKGGLGGMKARVSGRKWMDVSLKVEVRMGVRVGVRKSNNVSMRARVRIRIWKKIKIRYE